MPATVDEDGVLHMIDPDDISEFERWGNIGNRTMITVGAIATVQPTVVVLLDNDIPDMFNTPTAILLDPEVAGDPTYWVDDFSITGAGDHGNAAILASDVDGENAVGVFTKNVRTYRTVEAEGTKGDIWQDGMTVNIPSGGFDYTDGILLIHTPTPDAAPSIEEIIPVGPPVMWAGLDQGFDCMDAGYTAHVVMEYDESDIPEGGSESNLRIARWHESDRKWYFSGIFNVSHDMGNNEISFNASCMDLYAVVHTVGFRIADPVFMPWCNDYTGPWPVFYSIIEDVIHGVSSSDIQVRIDGPYGDPIFDDMIIWDDGEAADGWDGTYDSIANRLIMSIDEDYDWESYYDCDCATYGLPGGEYTLTYVAINGVGERKTLTWDFTVDATPPEVELLGDVVGAHPVIELQVSDEHAGLDLWKICADMYIVERVDDDCCYDGWYGPVENEERLGWVKPSSLKWKDDDEESGILLLEFGEVYFDGLSHGLSIDVVVYDCEHDCQDGDTDCDDCLCYYMEHGIADCVGNHATPIWRRYTIDIYHDDDGDDDGFGITDAYMYPNPYDVSSGEPATIYYSAEGAGRVTIKIFDFAGERVATVYDGWTAGTDRVHWYGQDNTGRVVGAGAYIGSITFDNGSAVMTRNFKIGVIK
jgi:hypothetical protein